jgi:hypothetical protein
MTFAATMTRKGIAYMANTVLDGGTAQSEKLESIKNWLRKNFTISKYTQQFHKPQEQHTEHDVVKKAEFSEVI